MELYSVFTTVLQTLILFGAKESARTLIMGLIFGGGVWLSLFIFGAFGIFRMAKRMGLKRKWLAFFPIINLVYIGKIAGEFQVFGQRMKRCGLYAMIAQILTTLLCAGLLVSQIYLYVAEGAPVYDVEMGGNIWYDLSGVSLKMYKFYEVSYMISYFAELVYQILLILLLNGLYRKYAPRNYFIFLILAFLIPPARYIVTFALSGKKPIDYEAYMRARREAYIRQQQQYYGGGYGSPYNRPYGNPNGNPYANPYNRPQQPPQEPEDPFSEFGGKKEDTPFSEFGNGNDQPKQRDENDPDGFFD
ncbi:MAG: hypothetical protein IJ317_03960 [Clostridia bacterium]|nr:hypothetical protein [Clostridia bacterium]